MRELVWFLSIQGALVSAVAGTQQHPVPMSALEDSRFGAAQFNQRIRIEGTLSELLTGENGARSVRLHSSRERLDNSDVFPIDGPIAYTFRSGEAIANLTLESSVVIEGIVKNSREVAECKLISVRDHEGPHPAPVLSAGDLKRSQSRLGKLGSDDLRFEPEKRRLTIDYGWEGESIPSGVLKFLVDSNWAEGVRVHERIEGQRAQRIVDALSRVKSLRRLELNMDVQGLDFRKLRDLPHLTDLVLSSADNAGDDFIQQLSKLPWLRRLDLRFGNSDQVTPVGFGHLTNCKFLRWCRVRHSSNVSDAHIRELANCRKLLELDVEVTRLDGSCLAALATLPQIHTLHFKAMPNAPRSYLGDDFLAESASLRWPSLKRIVLENDAVSDDGFTKFLGGSWPVLEDLRFPKSQRLSELAIRSLCKKPPRKLREIAFSNFEVSDDTALGLKDIRTLRRFWIPKMSDKARDRLYGLLAEH